MLLNYSNAARESGVSVKTIREYYQILEDTLIGRQLPPWRKRRKRRLIETAKFYFFDMGVVSALLNRTSLTPGTADYGRASANVRERPKGLHLFLEEHKCGKSLIVSRESMPRKLSSSTTVLPWRTFCEMLWAGEII